MLNYSCAVDERWSEIPGYEGFYEVSDMGRVRSLDRIVVDKQATRFRRFKGRLLKPQLTQAGYYVVALSKNGKPKDHYIHRLVLSAFVSLPEPGFEACHENDVRTDNRLRNLRWDTHLENVRDALTRNRMRSHNGEKTHCHRGHPFNETNTLIRPNGRSCRECRRINERRRYHERKKSLIHA